MLWIYAINNIITILVFIWYSKTLFVQANYPKKSIAMILLILIALKIVFNLFHSVQINMLVSILTYLGIAHSYFNGSITKKIVFIGFFMIVSFASEMVTYIFLRPILGIVGFQVNSPYFLFFGNILSILILVLLLYMITKMKDIKGMIDNKGLWYFSACPVMSIIIIFSMFSSSMLQTFPALCFYILIGIIMFNIIMCKGFLEIIKSKNIQIEHEKIKNQELHYQLLEEKIDNTKQLIHDIKKHVNILKGYTISNDFIKIKSYIDELSDEIKNEEVIVVTGNQLIDLSLNANKNIFLDNSIDIKYDVRIRDVHPISDLDFNIIFSNILDNAIESCIKTNGHFIKIKLDKVDGNVILKVINPCSYVNANYETTKRDRMNHGYGINIINKIVRKYDGIATFKFEEKNSAFISCVVFAMNR